MTEAAFRVAIGQQGDREGWEHATAAMVAAVYAADETQSGALAGALMSEALSEGLDAGWRTQVIAALKGGAPQHRREYLGTIFEGLLMAYVKKLATEAQP